MAMKKTLKLGLFKYLCVFSQHFFQSPSLLNFEISIKKTIESGFILFKLYEELALEKRVVVK